jgi:hypothetical protein
MKVIYRDRDLDDFQLVVIGVERTFNGQYWFNGAIPGPIRRWYPHIHDRSFGTLAKMAL